MSSFFEYIEMCRSEFVLYSFNLTQASLEKFLRNWSCSKMKMIIFNGVSCERSVLPAYWLIVNGYCYQFILLVGSLSYWQQRGTAVTYLVKEERNNFYQLAAWNVLNLCSYNSIINHRSGQPFWWWTNKQTIFKHGEFA